MVQTFLLNIFLLVFQYLNAADCTYRCAYIESVAVSVCHGYHMVQVTFLLLFRYIRSVDCTLQMWTRPKGSYYVADVTFCLCCKNFFRQVQVTGVYQTLIAYPADMPYMRWDGNGLELHRVKSIVNLQLNPLQNPHVTQFVEESLMLQNFQLIQYLHF